jgi:hypothetical protein
MTSLRSDSPVPDRVLDADDLALEPIDTSSAIPPQLYPDRLRQTQHFIQPYDHPGPDEPFRVQRQIEGHSAFENLAKNAAAPTEPMSVKELADAKDLPSELKDRRHQHTLFLANGDQYAAAPGFVCDACGGPGKGWSFHW